MMPIPRLGLYAAMAAAAAISLSSCVIPTAPEPADFKLSPEALTQKYRATRRAGTVRLYGQKITTTRDEWGRETHQATGGAVLVKEAQTPILAEAASITVTPAYSEVLGRSTVKRADIVLIGQDDAATIRIDGAEIIPQGAVRRHRLAPEGSAKPAPAPEAEAATESTPPPAAATATTAVGSGAASSTPTTELNAAGYPTAAPASAMPKPAPAKRKKAPQARRPAPAPTASNAPAPAAATATPKPSAPKAAAPAPKPATPAPAPKPAAPAAAPEKSRVLNLMREPTSEG